MMLMILLCITKNRILGLERDLGLGCIKVKLLEEALMHICAWPPFLLYEATGVGADASLPGLVGMISV